ncbi:DNA-directed RNA polymerase sigma-70 factor [Puia dinghuensis]|uniref:RNA polymerase sigma factor n=2 Tax=Puia dinghuensis TaxID=1792502 RepID=A0A8J2UB39_9BACT|nr:DNA-directed RNA polymerase sigma-70 factor [Puia dinghuensis]
MDCAAFFNAIAAGDETAFELFFEQTRVRVYTLAYRWTKSVFAAEEITQDVFISVWTGRRHLAAVKDAESYFSTIIYNKIYRHLRKEASKARVLQLSSRTADKSSNETEETIYINDGERFINKALEHLSPKKRLIYHLSRKEGKSYDEIAAALRLSPHTVKSHLAHALKFIRNYMKDNILSILWLMALLFVGKK